MRQRFGFIYQRSAIIYSNNYDARCHPLFNHQNRLHALSLPASWGGVTRGELPFSLHVRFEEHATFHFWKGVETESDSIVLVSVLGK